MNMKRLLRACSPHHHPYRWLAVNCAVLLWSAVLLAEIISTSDGHEDDERTRVEFDYLVYNFGTCLVWLVEVFFNVLDHKEYDLGGVGEESLLRPVERAERTRNEVIALWVEVALAVYFFVDSTSVAVHLSRKQIHRQSRGMTFDVCLALAAYGYMIYRQYVDWKKGFERDIGQTTEQSSTSERPIQSEEVV